MVDGRWKRAGLLRPGGTWELEVGSWEFAERKPHARRGLSHLRLIARHKIVAKKAISTTPTTTTPAATTGYLRATTPRPITKASSPRLRIQFENGSGLVFATARVPDFVK